MNLILVIRKLMALVGEDIKTTVATESRISRTDASSAVTHRKRVNGSARAESRQTDVPYGTGASSAATHKKRVNGSARAESPQTDVPYGTGASSGVIHRKRVNGSARAESPQTDVPYGTRGNNRKNTTTRGNNTNNREKVLRNNAFISSQNRPHP
ncbi:hypothetical protein AVEN_68459-1 [Araneus ventricosus]|uniref:Uncharacterized protein n=1 Tax=Araneus ventricosus TaxID=182803 RepID=A0A4Y2PS45_ARAVE|nr:hypothetical protein AVEN_68459-1 [Araneus ventricosus]